MKLTFQKIVIMIYKNFNTKRRCLVKNFLMLIGASFLFCSLSSYVVEEKEKVYVAPAPVVEEVNVHHYHRHYHPELEFEVR